MRPDERYWQKVEDIDQQEGEVFERPEWQHFGHLLSAVDDPALAQTSLTSPWPTRLATALHPATPEGTLDLLTRDVLPFVGQLATVRLERRQAPGTLPIALEVPLHLASDLWPVFSPFGVADTEPDEWFDFPEHARRLARKVAAGHLNRQDAEAFLDVHFPVWSSAARDHLWQHELDDEDDDDCLLMNNIELLPTIETLAGYSDHFTSVMNDVMSLIEPNLSELGWNLTFPLLSNLSERDLLDLQGVQIDPHEFMQRADITTYDDDYWLDLSAFFPGGAVCSVMLDATSPGNSGYTLTGLLDLDRFGLGVSVGLLAKRALEIAYPRDRRVLIGGNQET